MTSEFFEGPVSRDYGDIPDAVGLLAAAKKKAAKKAVKTKSCNTTGKTSGSACSQPHVCQTKKKKASAFVPELPGWSAPPARPSL